MSANRDVTSQRSSSNDPISAIVVSCASASKMADRPRLFDSQTAATSKSSHQFTSIVNIKTLINYTITFPYKSIRKKPHKSPLSKTYCAGCELPKKGRQLQNISHSRLTAGRLGIMALFSKKGRRKIYAGPYFAPEDFFAGICF